jgi:predicted membrane protein
VNFSALLVWCSFVGIFGIEDNKDSSEKDQLALILTLAAAVEIVTKVLYIVYDLNRKRKANMLIGIFGLSFCWLSVSICWFSENYFVPKLFAFLFSYFTGPVLMSTYYVYLGDLCEPESIGLSLAVTYGMAAIILFTIPYTIPNQGSWKWFG